MAPVAHSHIISAGIDQEESRIRSQTHRDEPQASASSFQDPRGSRPRRDNTDKMLKHGTASHAARYPLKLAKGMYSIVDCLLPSDHDQIRSDQKSSCQDTKSKHEVRYLL